MIYSTFGLDEISVCAPTRVAELKDGLIRIYDIQPEQYFGELAESESLKGGEPAINAEITRNILNGEKGPHRNVVLLNASAALVAAGKAEDLKEGIRLAEAAIDEGAATKKLEKLIEYINDNT